MFSLCNSNSLLSLQVQSVTLKMRADAECPCLLKSLTESQFGSRKAWGRRGGTTKTIKQPCKQDQRKKQSDLVK